MKETICKNMFESENPYITYLSGRRSGKNYDKTLMLIEASQKLPNENTLFIGRNIFEQLDTVCEFLKLKWFIYIESDYENLQRNQFIGKFKVLGVIDNEKRPKE